MSRFVRPVSACPSWRVNRSNVRSTDVVPQSKYRHVYGEKAKAHYDNVKISGSAWDTDLISASAKYLAVNWQVAGGGVGRFQWDLLVAHPLSYGTMTGYRYRPCLLTFHGSTYKRLPNEIAGLDATGERAHRTCFGHRLVPIR